MNTITFNDLGMSGQIPGLPNSVCRNVGLTRLVPPYDGAGMRCNP